LLHHATDGRLLGNKPVLRLRLDCLSHRMVVHEHRLRLMRRVRLMRLTRLVRLMCLL
jgi:hypothetical protein